MKNQVVELLKFIGCETNSNLNHVSGIILNNQYRICFMFNGNYFSVQASDKKGLEGELISLLKIDSIDIVKYIIKNLHFIQENFPEVCEKI